MLYIILNEFKQRSQQIMQFWKKKKVCLEEILCLCVSAFYKEMRCKNFDLLPTETSLEVN